MATYTIKRGDTLGKIARQFGTTVSALASSNNIANPDRIFAGKTFTIPSQVSAGGRSLDVGNSTSSSGNYFTTPSGAVVDTSTGQLVSGPPANKTQSDQPAQNSNLNYFTTPSGAIVDASTGALIKNPPASSSQQDNGSFSSTIAAPKSTGNAQLDAIQKGIADLGNTILSKGYTIPPQLQITPDTVAKFLAFAHQAVDPYTKQLLDSEIDNVNADLKNQQTQYENSKAETLQGFGTQLSTIDNNAAASGVAFSGQRGLADQNLVNSTNRTLSSLASNSAFNAGNTLRTGAGQVGSANAGRFTTPTFNIGSVALGGMRGTTADTGSADLGYRPNIYTVGSIPDIGTRNANNQQQNYLSQYGTLAGTQSNSGRSFNDLVGMMSGLPSNYKASLT